MTNSSQAIGVFDSGVGGLTVLRSLIEKFPQENFIYLGDTARLPYGTKSPETIYKYSKQIIEFLISKKVKAIVIACNTASSHFTETQLNGVPIFNVIEPGSLAAISHTQNMKIGILGTRATVQSASYQKRILEIDPSVEVYAQACPLFVPLAEEGLAEDPITNLIAYRYLQPLLASGIDTLVLGCTHYPILRAAIQKAAGKDVQLIESGEVLAAILKSAQEQGLLSRNPQDSNHREIKILSTDSSEHFQTLAQSILQDQLVTSYEVVDL